MTGVFVTLSKETFHDYDCLVFGVRWPFVGAGNPPTDPGRFARARVGWVVASFVLRALRHIGFFRVLHLLLSD